MSFHAGQSFTFGETPSATKWNYLWENDYALQDWTAFTNATFPNELVPEGEITLEKLNASVAFLATHNASQNSGNGSFAAMSFNTEVFDYGGDFASSEFVAPVDGVYHFEARTHAGDGSITRAILSLYVNRGSGYAEECRGTDYAATLGAGTGVVVTGLLQLDAGDSVKVYSFYSATKSLLADIPSTHFSGFLVGEI